MNIIPVAAKPDMILSPLSDNNVIKLLEKQKMQLQEQIQKTNESKLDDKTKQERIRQLQDQIQQIDMEIQQKRNEKLNQNQSSNKEPAANQLNTGVSVDGSNLADMSHLMQASTTYSQAKIMNTTKSNLNARGNVLKMEIKLDEIRGGDAKTKKAELQETEQKGQMLDKKVGETLQTSQKQVKASKEESKGNNINNTGKSEETGDTQKAIMDNSENIHNVTGNDEKESPQLQGIKAIDKKYRKVDIRV